MRSRGHAFLKIPAGYRLLPGIFHHGLRLLGVSGVLSRNPGDLIKEPTDGGKRIAKIATATDLGH